MLLAFAYYAHIVTGIVVIHFAYNEDYWWRHRVRIVLGSLHLVLAAIAAAAYVSSWDQVQHQPVEGGAVVFWTFSSFMAIVGLWKYLQRIWRLRKPRYQAPVIDYPRRRSR